jgi:hypothetical protein
MIQDQSLRKFILKSFLISVFCFLIAWTLSNTSFKQHYFSGVFWLIPLIMVITMTIHSLLVAASKKNPAKFINKFMAFSGLKLLLYFFIILAYIYFIKQDIILFLCAFLSLYFIFTILEISSILSYLKKK